MHFAPVHQSQATAGRGPPVLEPDSRSTKVDDAGHVAIKTGFSKRTPSKTRLSMSKKRISIRVAPTLVGQPSSQAGESTRGAVISEASFNLKIAVLFWRLITTPITPNAMGSGSAPGMSVRWYVPERISAGGYFWTSSWSFRQLPR